MSTWDHVTARRLRDAQEVSARRRGAFFAWIGGKARKAEEARQRARREAAAVAVVLTRPREEPPTREAREFWERARAARSLEAEALGRFAWGCS